VIFWAIAIGMAAWLAVTLYTGQIRGRGNVLLVDRNDNANHYWLCVAGIAVVTVGTFCHAIAPPY
jgi:hypothetical protein